MRFACNFWNTDHRSYKLCSMQHSRWHCRCRNCLLRPILRRWNDACYDLATSSKEEHRGNSQKDYQGWRRLPNVKHIWKEAVQTLLGTSQGGGEVVTRAPSCLYAWILVSWHRLLDVKGWAQKRMGAIASKTWSQEIHESDIWRWRQTYMLAICAERPYSLLR